MLSTKTSPQASATRPFRKACGVDVVDAIYERRSVRAFEDYKLGVRTIEHLIDAAIQAPSARNEQPWCFTVVQEKHLLHRLSERSKELARAKLEPGTPLWEHRTMLEDPNYDVFHGATTLIVLCARSDERQAAEDVCLAAQNLMLAAHGLGLGTCPIGFARDALNEPEFRAELGIGSSETAVFPVVVGLPTSYPSPTPRRPALILRWR